MPINNTYEFEVEGHGDFPVDMLRYDRACPATEVDSGLILKMIANPRLARHSQRVKIICHRNNGPTYGRWASFGWSIIGPVKKHHA